LCIEAEDIKIAISEAAVGFVELGDGSRLIRLELGDDAPEHGLGLCGRAELRLDGWPKAAWRRGWDSNPRAACAASGFQDRCIQPLCHLSAVNAVARVSFYQAADTDPVPAPTTGGAVSRPVP